MRPAIVTISYRQVIDATQQGWFEKAVLKASYDEFVLKSQAYNLEGKYKTFKEMVAADGRVNSMHYKCAFPLGPVVEQLKNEIPQLLDNTGKAIRFDSYESKLIDSDITNRLAHQVVITYISAEYTLLDNANDYLLLTDKEAEDGKYSGTFLLKIVPGLSVHSYRAVENQNAIV